MLKAIGKILLVINLFVQTAIISLNYLQILIMAVIEMVGISKANKK